MNNLEIIRKRLDIIQTLESLKLRIEPRAKDHIYEVTIQEINEFIKKKLQPFVDNQKEEIKKLL